MSSSDYIYRPKMSDSYMLSKGEDGKRQIMLHASTWAIYLLSRIMKFPQFHVDIFLTPEDLLLAIDKEISLYSNRNDVMTRMSWVINSIHNNVWKEYTEYKEKEKNAAILLTHKFFR